MSKSYNKHPKPVPAAGGRLTDNTSSNVLQILAPIHMPGNV